MFYYSVKFRLANDKENINLLEHKEKFKRALEDFNLKGEKARTYKKILVQNVHSTFIEILFESSRKIDIPTMVFRGYSQYLIVNFDLGNWTTRGGGFLRGFETIELQEDDVKEFLDSDRKTSKSFSNVDLLKRLIDIFFYDGIESGNKKKKREKIRSQIVLLLNEYDLLMTEEGV